MKRKNLAPKVTAAIFLLLLAWLTADNLGILLGTAGSYLRREITFADVMRQITAGYQEELKQKEPLISLNGAYMRLTGARVSNGIVLMKNGMLAEETASADPQYAAGQITELYQYLKDRDTPFLFVESPRKPDIDSSLMPEGTQSHCHENADGLLRLLNDNGVPTLDLRPELSGSAQALEQYFYRTDHHWNAEGAFVAFQRIVERLGEGDICARVTQRENWDKHILPNYFLGSHGRRVGIGFAGLDDFIYLTPKFDTRMSCTIPSLGIFRSGDFFAAAFDERQISGKPNYYGSTPYTAHTGDDYPLVLYQNENAPSTKRILMIKDSFGLPLEGFLATAFREVETLDLRHLEGKTGVEAIADFRPDVVIVMYNPYVMEGECLQFGLDDV